MKSCSPTGKEVSKYCETLSGYANESSFYGIFEADDETFLSLENELTQLNVSITEITVTNINVDVGEITIHMKVRTYSLYSLSNYEGVFIMKLSYS